MVSFFKNYFNSNDLKTRAILTAISRVFSLVTNFIIQLIITPLILNGLGKYLYGIYTLINKTESYLSLVDLRPSAILRFKLALLNNNSMEKNEYVGATLILSFISLPIIILIGYIISILFPYFFKVDPSYYSLTKIAIIITAIFLGLKSFLGFPEAILRGNNQEYRGMFLEPFRLILYGVLVYYSLIFNFGLLGIISSVFISNLIVFFFRLYIQSQFCPGFFPSKPQKGKIIEISKQSIWYLGSSFSVQILNTFDVILIGLLFSPEHVAVFALSKAILFRIGESFSTLTSSITAGIGKLVSDNNFSSLYSIKNRIYRLNIIFGIMLMCYFIIFNKYFLTLWVGASNYVGNTTNLFLCITMFFILLNSSDDIFINALMLFKEKTTAIFISSIISIILAIILGFKYKYLGIAISLAIGRLVLWSQYQIILNKKINNSFKALIIANYKIIVLFLIIPIYKYLIDQEIINTWGNYIFLTFIFIIVNLFLLFFVILTKFERSTLMNAMNLKFK